MSAAMSTEQHRVFHSILDSDIQDFARSLQDQLVSASPRLPAFASSVAATPRSARYLALRQTLTELRTAPMSASLQRLRSSLRATPRDPAAERLRDQLGKIEAKLAQVGQQIDLAASVGWRQLIEGKNSLAMMTTVKPKSRVRESISSSSSPSDSESVEQKSVDLSLEEIAHARRVPTRIAAAARCASVRVRESLRKGARYASVSPELRRRRGRGTRKRAESLRDSLIHSRKVGDRYIGTKQKDEEMAMAVTRQRKENYELSRRLEQMLKKSKKGLDEELRERRAEYERLRAAFQKSETLRLKQKTKIAQLQRELDQVRGVTRVPAA